MDETRPIRALILSGGGARGAYEAGVAASLAERMHFDIVCGTSIGGVNGFAVAQGMADQLEAIWIEAAEHDVAPYRPEIGGLMRLWSDVHAAVSDVSLTRRLHDALAMLESLPGLRELPRLQGLLGVLDSKLMRDKVSQYARHENLQSALLLAATNLTSVDGTIFAHFPENFPDPERAARFLSYGDVEPLTVDNYVDAVCASAAIPGAFEPVVIRCKDGNQHTFVDGAFTNNTPLCPAIDAGATEIIAISVEPLVTHAVERKVRNLGDVVALALEAATSQMLQLDRKVLQLTNDTVAGGATPGKHHVTLREVRPAEKLLIDPLDFTAPDKIAALVAQGRRDAERLLDAAPAA
jgi:NTE family protein